MRTAAAAVKFNDARDITHHVSPDGCLADFDTELEQLGVNSWRTPQRVGNAHLSDQVPNLAIHDGPPNAA
jgi:hypothetical protein